MIILTKLKTMWVQKKIQVGCSSVLDASLEEQDILYTAVDKYGNTGYAKMTVKIVGNENESLS